MMEAMRALTLTASLLLIMAMTPAMHAQRPAPDLSPGVSQSLALERASRLSDVHYKLSFDIPLSRGDRIPARLTLAFALSDASAPLALDFEPNAMGSIRHVSVAGATVDARVQNGHLLLPASTLRAGPNVVAIDFDAGDAPLNRNDDFLYTILVPARAHEAFPCFDQPDLKARWTLDLTVPESWETLANGAETARTVTPGRQHVSFAETEPIATYLFAFAAGRFSVEQGQRNGRTFRMVHRETDAQKVARNRDTLFDLHAAALNWLEQYTGIPYPFGKFDFFLVPAFQFGGMEHPGAVFYNASGLMLDESATQNQLLERASTISHETSHMWFGDLVTMKWFTDVWMKEVFANFMAAKIVNPSFPTVNHDLRFLHAYYPLAYDVDRTAGTNAIRQPLDNLKDAGTLYGAIIYQKAPIVMRQLETIMGPEAFRDGLRDYLRQHQFGNASWPDLIALLDDRTPEDLAAWSHAWVEEDGRPIITTELTLAEGRITRLAFTTRDPVTRRGLTWTQDIQVALGYADRMQLMPVHLSGSRTEVSAARGLPAPLFVLPNGGGIAYGELHLDRQSLAWLADHLPEIGDPLTRGAAWVTLWEAMLDAELPPVRFLDLTVAALPRETDELNIQRMLSYLEQANWKFVPEAIRTSRAASIEQTLRNGLEKASTTSLKSAYFSALRDVAVTPPTLGWLTRIWGGQETMPGLTLAEADFIVLAQELAVREVPGWRTLIQQQIDRTQNPDRKARLQFVVPALSSDATDRDRFFASLADVNNRRHEPWVLDGLHYLHHPLRAPTSLKYIGPSLNLLQEIQRTGDIFFPKRWMDATLGGHRSLEAARAVRSFLDQLPSSYPDRLRRIVLSSADDLFRASGERPIQLIAR
jgi:aminopeptidase N